MAKLMCVHSTLKNSKLFKVPSLVKKIEFYTHSLAMKIILTENILKSLYVYDMILIYMN